MGGGGGGGGYTGGGGGGSSSCGTALVGSGGGGGGSSWISSSSTSDESQRRHLAYPTSTACAFGTDPGYGGDTPTTRSATAGYAGCAGTVTSAVWNGNAPSAPTLTSGSLTVTAGNALSATISSANTASYTLTWTGTTPSGVNFNSTTGAVSGTPTVAGNYPFTVTSTNPFGTSSASNFTLVVNANIGTPTKVVFSAEPPTTGTPGRS